MFAILMIIGYGFVGSARALATEARPQEKVVVTREVPVSTMQGIVTDPTNAPVPGAEVVVVRAVRKKVSGQSLWQAGPEIVSAYTSERGAFSFRKLRPGRYGLLIRKRGFDEMFYPRVLLNRHASKRNSIRITMELAM